MASIIKRGNSYRARVKHKGKQYTKTFPTKTLAKEWAGRKEQQLKSYASGVMGKSKTVGDAFTRYMKEVSPTKKGARWETIRLEKFKTYDLAAMPLEVLKPADLAEWRDMRLKQVSASSVRRELHLMAAVFSQCCREWNWLSETPMTYVKRPASAQPRDRRVSDSEIAKLKDEFGYDIGTPILKSKQLVGAFFLLAIETGMRLGEMCKLRSEHIFLDDHYLTLMDTKNGTDRNVPLGPVARSIMKDVLDTHVRVSSAVASATFQRACREKKISDLHFHDTRHEATTRLAKKLDIMDLARMTGHRDLKSLLIYYNATPKEIAAQLG